MRGMVVQSVVAGDGRGKIRWTSTVVGEEAIPIDLEIIALSEKKLTE